MTYAFTDIEAKIFDAIKNATIDNAIMSRAVELKTGIDARLLAANVRSMNEKFKGHFHIGSSKKKGCGYWLCRNEAEAVVSLINYGKTTLTELRTIKQIKEQIKLTFPTPDLFNNAESGMNAEMIELKRKIETIEQIVL